MRCPSCCVPRSVTVTRPHHRPRSCVTTGRIGHRYSPRMGSPFDIVLAALAAHRAARAVAVDTITQPLRERLEEWSVTDGISDRQLAVREKVVELVHCPHCIGFWLSLCALAATRVRWLRPVVAWWAVAGIQSTLASVQQAADQAPIAVDELADDTDGGES